MSDTPREPRTTSVDAASLDQVLAQYPAPASPPEVLALEPNRAADATEGPHPQISPTLYVRMSKPDGSEFLAPKANVATYEAKGFVAGADVEIEDLVAYWAQAAKPAPAEPTPATSTRSTSKSASSSSS